MMLECPRRAVPEFPQARFPELAEDISKAPDKWPALRVLRLDARSPRFVVEACDDLLRQPCGPSAFAPHLPRTQRLTGSPRGAVKDIGIDLWTPLRRLEIEPLNSWLYHVLLASDDRERVGKVMTFAGSTCP